MNSLNRHETLAAKLTTLQAEVARIRNEGEYLQGVRLEWAAAGGTASASSHNSYKYARLRAGKGKALSSGKKSQYIPVADIARYESEIERGKRLTKLERQINQLQKKLGTTIT